MARDEAEKMSPAARGIVPSVTAVFDDLLREEREFPPSLPFTGRAIVGDRRIYDYAAKDPEGFWENEARELHWFKPWSKVLDWEPPHAKWFVGGATSSLLGGR